MKEVNRHTAVDKFQLSSPEARDIVQSYMKELENYVIEDIGYFTQLIESIIGPKPRTWLHWRDNQQTMSLVNVNDVMGRIHDDSKVDCPRRIEITRIQYGDALAREALPEPFITLVKLNWEGQVMLSNRIGLNFEDGLRSSEIGNDVNLGFIEETIIEYRHGIKLTEDEAQNRIHTLKNM